MAHVDGPALIAQRGLYFNSTAAIITEIEAEIAKSTPVWGNIVGTGKLVDAANVIGKVVEGPTGIAGASATPEDEPVLGQQEADRFFGQATREDIVFSTQARHANSVYAALRDLMLTTRAALAYTEKESDTKWTVYACIVQAGGSTYNGDVGTTAARHQFTFSRASNGIWVPQA